jgi:Raf kinase inhibitor-like YbhB/YbcL family protein
MSWVSRHAVVLAVLLAGCGGGHRSSAAGARATAEPAATATTGRGATAGTTATGTRTTATGTRTTATASRTTATTPAPAPPATLAKNFRLTSPAFKPGGAIPRQYTCDGAGAPIPLAWSGVPKSAKELVLMMRDPDAPSGDFIHWAVAGINPRSNTPTGVNGRNSEGRAGYAAPCPPPGRPHHYVITLSALSGPSKLKPGFAPDQLRTAAVGIATLVGTYARR